jgi:hypothetical protein
MRQLPRAAPGLDSRGVKRLVLVGAVTLVLSLGLGAFVLVFFTAARLSIAPFASISATRGATFDFVKPRTDSRNMRSSSERMVRGWLASVMNRLVDAGSAGGNGGSDSELPIWSGTTVFG